MRVSRRQFINHAAVGTAAFAAAPIFVRASDKSGNRLPVVGSGEFEFECEHNWDRKYLPSDHAYGNASHGVAVDQQGLIYITHQGNPGSIFVFEPNGKFLRSMGKLHNKGTGKGHGIDIRQEGSEEFIYLSPSDATLFYTKMTLGGEVVWKKGRAEINKDSGGVLDQAKRYRPTNTSFRPDGGYYLGDGYGSNYLFEYDRDDKFVRAIGGAGKQDGQFSTPHGQWLDDRDGTPKLVVADRANKRLQWFDSEGKHIKTLDGFLFPADIDTKDDLMLIPDLHARITILDAENSFAAHLGDDEQWRAQVLGNRMKMRGTPEQCKPGRFIHPHDACFDANGDIFVVEWVKTGRVTKLVRKA